MNNRGMLLAAALLVGGLIQAASACESTYSSELKNIRAADDEAWQTSPQGKAFIPAVEAEATRNRRVAEIQRSEGLCGFEDYLSAATVRSRGFAMADKLEAIKLASVAQSLDPSSVEAKSIFAHVMDEIVFQAQGKQLYGTLKDQTDGVETTIPTIDGVVPDAEKQLVKSVSYRGFIK